VPSTSCRRLALFVVALAAGSCARGGSASLPFDGARPLTLESVKQGKAPTPKELEQIVAAVVDVAGGAERLRRLRWRRVDDLYLAHPADPLGNNVLCTIALRPDESVTTRLEYRSGFVERRVRFRGEEYFQPRDGTLTLLTGAAQQYVEWDWEVARLPVLLTEAAALEPLAPRVVDGRTLVGMKVDVADLNPKFEAWVDLSGPMIVEVRAVLPIAGGFSTKTDVIQLQRFSDFRRVGGVLFPFRRHLEVDGERFGLAETRTVELDVDLKDEEFLQK